MGDVCWVYKGFLDTGKIREGERELGFEIIEIIEVCRNGEPKLFSNLN